MGCRAVVSAGVKPTAVAVFSDFAICGQEELLEPPRSDCGGIGPTSILRIEMCPTAYSLNDSQTTVQSSVMRASLVILD